LDQHSALGVAQGIHDGVGAVPPRGEAHGHPRGGRAGRGGRWRGLRNRGRGHAGLPDQAELIIRALVTPPPIAADICAMVGGARVQPVAGVLVGLAGADAAEHGQAGQDQHEGETP
jgi:hypothetical protein